MVLAGPRELVRDQPIGVSPQSLARFLNHLTQAQMKTRESSDGDSSAKPPSPLLPLGAGCDRIRSPSFLYWSFASTSNQHFSLCAESD